MHDTSRWLQGPRLRWPRGALALAAAVAALAGCKGHLPESSDFRNGVAVAAPAAYTDLCRREPAVCALHRSLDDRGAVELDRATFQQLGTVNRAVNRELRYASDSAVFGRHEYWTVPTRAGDCEDFALLKLQRLRALGFPRRALRMAIAVGDDGVMHAVLAVQTDRGTYILDNNHAEPQPWTDMGYTAWRWEDPGEGGWLANDDGGRTSATASR